MKTITKLGLAVMLLFLVSFFTQANAQSHDIKARNCKYWKEPPRMGSGAQVTDFSVCKVCSEKKDKEDAAKRAEDKRRHEALVAKTKAENERKAKEDAEKQRLQNEKNKPVNATIVMSSSVSGDTKFEYAESIAKKYERKPKEYKIQRQQAYNETLKEFRSKGFFGVYKDGSPIWQKDTEGNRFFIDRFSQTNYFYITDNVGRKDPENLYANGEHGSGFRSNVNSKSIVDMNGNTKTIDGHPFFESVGQNYHYPEFGGGYGKVWYALVIDRNYTLVSDKGSSKANHKTKFYNSLNDLLEVHNAYAAQENGGYQLFATSSTLYILDENLKVLDKIKGYDYFYTGWKSND